MRSLVTRYRIPTHSTGVANHNSHFNSLPQPPAIQTQATPSQSRSDALLLKLETLQKENESLRENLKAKDAELNEKSKEWAKK